MLGSKRVQMLLMILGALIVIICLLADTFRIGKNTQLGYKQIIGALFGLLVFAFGLIVRLRAKNSV